MEAQSSPHHDKPTSDLNALFEELEKRGPKPAPLSAPPRSPNSTNALLGNASRRSAPPPPPPASRRAPVEAQRIDEEAELIEDDDADATGKHAAARADAILPTYDAEIDDAPTIARPSPLSQLSLEIPSRAAPPPSSVRLPPPPSLRTRPTTSSIAKLSAPAAPLKSASELPVPSRSKLPALTPPPSRASVPVPSRPSVAPASVVAREPRERLGSQPTTIPPVARSDSLAAVPAPAKKGSGLLWAAAAGFGLLLAAGGAAVGLSSGVLGAGSAPSGAIVVTAAGANDAPVSDLRVLVDGETRCTSSPCRVVIGAGTHFVRAEAPGFVATADRAVSVETDGEATLHVALSPVAAPKPAAPAAAEPPAPVAKLVTLETEKTEAPAPAAAKAAPASKVAAAKPAQKKNDAEAAGPSQKPAAGGSGTLNINSIPMANVVLDGRPVGSTPLVGLSVSPGPHTVVFIHPEHGRKVVGTKVEAGKTATAAVRF